MAAFRDACGGSARLRGAGRAAARSPGLRGARLKVMSTYGRPGDIAPQHRIILIRVARPAPPDGDPQAPYEAARR